MYLEEEVGTEAYTLTADCDLGIADISALGKPTALVELRVVRDVALWHDTANLAVSNHYGAVVEVVLVVDWHTHNRNYRAWGSQQRLQSLVARLDNSRLQEQIAAGVTRERQLREYHDAYTSLHRLGGHLVYRLCVGVAIGNFNQWCCSCHLNKSKSFVHTFQSISPTTCRG